MAQDISSFGMVTRRATLPAMLLGLLGWPARTNAQPAPQSMHAAVPDLFVTAGHIALAADQSAFRTIGHTHPGRGAALYVVSPDSSNLNATAWRVRMADGRWFQLAEPTPDTFMFGGIGDGLHDDTVAIRAQHEYCVAHGLPMLLPVPPISWRTTETIRSRATSWHGMGERIRWTFDPAEPEAQDMRACLQLDECFYGAIENIDFQGPHHYDAANPTTYVRDATQGPQAEDGGWYDGFFRPGCCAVRVSGNSQPIFRHVWTSGHSAGSFKVGLCLDTATGHVEIGSGCRHYDLIGIRVMRNGDDYKFHGEPIITNGFCGVLFGTSNLNGSFNGGMGIRSAEFYIGACPYGILQMHDHGPRGTPLANPQYPIEGVYGTLNGSFFEFIGEAALQTLPTAICRDLTYSDMARFSWEDRFRLSDQLASARHRQRAAFRLGQLSCNCHFGTVRAKPDYRSPWTQHPEACSILIHLSDADPSTTIARPILSTTRILRTAPVASLHVAEGRAVHAGDLSLASDILDHGNLLRDPLDSTVWIGPPVVIGSSAAADPLPAEMILDLGRDPQCVEMNTAGLRNLPFVTAPDRSVEGMPIYFTAWIHIAEGSALFRLVMDDPTGADLYAVTWPETDGWQRLVIGGGVAAVAAGLRLEIRVNAGRLHLAGPMVSLGRRRAFNRHDGPVALRPVRLEAGVTVSSTLATDGVATRLSAPLAGQGGALPATPSGYLQILIDGAARVIPYY